MIPIPKHNHKIEKVFPFVVLIFTAKFRFET